MTPIWILCTPRSGSSYLSKLLDNSNAFPDTFDEKLAWKRHKYNSIRDLTTNPPICAKILHVQWNRLEYGFEPGDISISSKQHVIKPTLTPTYPVRYIILERTDIIEHTLSYYIAAKTSKKESFFCLDSQQKQHEFLKTAVEQNDAEVLQYYQVVSQYRGIWDKFIGDHDVLRINYEDLLKNPQEELTKILRYCGVSGEYKEPKIYKAATARDDIVELKDWLKSLVHKNNYNV